MSDWVIELHVPVTPVAKGRPKFFTPPGASFGRAVTPKKTVNAEDTIKHYAIAQGVTPVEGPVHVDLEFRYEPPASMSKKKRGMAMTYHEFRTKKPDLDNLIKTVLDALNELAWKDDASVVSVSARKIYAVQSETVVRVRSAGVAMFEGEPS